MKRQPLVLKGSLAVFVPVRFLFCIVSAECSVHTCNQNHPTLIWIRQSTAMFFKPSVLALFGLFTSTVFAQLPLRFVSFNIRYDNTDLSLGDAEKWWLSLTCASDATQCRAPGVVSLLCKWPPKCEYLK